MAADAELERALDELVAAGAVVEHDDGRLTTSDDFESTRGIYEVSYGDASDEKFRDTVADLFGLDEAEAQAVIEDNGVTREELVAYLSLRSFLDDPPAHDRLATMAGLVAEIGPGSPVPRGLREIDDDAYDEFVVMNSRAVVFAFKHNCAPCERMKDDIDDVLDAIPEDVAVAGIDAESAPSFREAYDVDSAPTTLFFDDGEVERSLEGRLSPESIATLSEEVFGEK